MNLMKKSHIIGVDQLSYDGRSVGMKSARTVNTNYKKVR